MKRTDPAKSAKNETRDRHDTLRNEVETIRSVLGLDDPDERTKDSPHGTRRPAHDHDEENTEGSKSP
jgi:hypothetical protein